MRHSKFSHDKNEGGLFTNLSENYSGFVNFVSEKIVDSKWNRNIKHMSTFLTIKETVL